MKISIKTDHEPKRMTVPEIIEHASISSNKRDGFIDVTGELYIILPNSVFNPHTWVTYGTTAVFNVLRFCDLEIIEL
jgi:hypothetical protein